MDFVEFDLIKIKKTVVFHVLELWIDLLETDGANTKKIVLDDIKFHYKNLKEIYKGEK